MQGECVVVTGSEYTGGLAALRGLRAAGFRPVAAVTSRDSYGAFSRAAVGVLRVCDPRLDPAAFAGDLAAGAARIGARVVLPGTEPGLLALAQHAHVFPPQIKVGVPELAAVLAATDKLTLPELAASAGLQVPPTTLVTPSTRPQDLVFPAVLKPLRSEIRIDGQMHRFEARQVRTAAAMDTELATLPERTGLHQPYLRGDIRTVNGVAWHGELITTVHKLADRTWPIDCGVVCHATTTPVHPHLEAAARSIMRTLNWSGLFNLQLIEAPTGEHYLIDLNPRIYHSLALAIRAGANLPAMWASLLLGRRPDTHPYREGIHFRAEEDFFALTRDRTLRNITKLLPRPRTTHPVLSLTDPKPSLITLRRLTKKVRSKDAVDLASTPR